MDTYYDHKCSSCSGLFYKGGENRLQLTTGVAPVLEVAATSENL